MLYNKDYEHQVYHKKDNFKIKNERFLIDILCMQHFFSQMIKMKLTLIDILLVI